jgi:hypothetical protein
MVKKLCILIILLILKFNDAQFYGSANDPYNNFMSNLFNWNPFNTPFNSYPNTFNVGAPQYAMGSGILPPSPCPNIFQHSNNGHGVIMIHSNERKLIHLVVILAANTQLLLVSTLCLLSIREILVVEFELEF